MWCLFYFLLRRCKIDKFILFIILFYCSLLFSTFYFNQSYVNLIYEFASILSWIVLFKINMLDNKDKFLTTLENTFSFCCWLILLLSFCFRGFYLNSSGYSGNYFLGYDNNLITYIFPALALSFTNSLNKNGKIVLKSIFLLIISFCSIIFTWSATGIVSMVIMIALFLVYTINKKIFQ